MKAGIMKKLNIPQIGEIAPTPSQVNTGRRGTKDMIAKALEEKVQGTIANEKQ